MKILCLADLHIKSIKDLSFLRKLNSSDYELVILLGDIDEISLEYIVEQVHPHKRIFGVLGNHDEFNSFEDLPIVNLNGLHILAEGYSFVGIEGSYKYKSSTFPSFEQEKSIEFTNRLLKADVILSHTSPYGVNERGGPSHQGLKGINSYIDKHSPKWNLHGHQHHQLATKYKDTTIQGIYGAAIIDLNTGTVEHLLI